MSNQSSWAALLDWLLRLLGGASSPQPETPQTGGPASLPDSADEPARIIRNRVLMVVFDPPVDESGRTLRQAMNWRSPEQLANDFSREILEDSSGLARYEIVERVVWPEFPRFKDGFQYDAETYLRVLQGVEPPHQLEQADYAPILQRLNALERVASGEIDEIWLFAFPHAGFYESVMGGRGAFWCNGPVLKGTESCPRRFVVMGFSYERGLGEMLESFGHRAESIMAQTFAGLRGEANLWERFTRYDQKNPGQAAVGTIHFAPNSERDYDWGNPRYVPSECYDWLNNFPDFQGDVRQVNAAEWGNGDLLLHHRWWLRHLPHVAGRKNGVHHNWWQYILRPEYVAHG